MGDARPNEIERIAYLLRSLLAAAWFLFRINRTSITYRFACIDNIIITTNKHTGIWRITSILLF